MALLWHYTNDLQDIVGYYYMNVFNRDFAGPLESLLSLPEFHIIWGKGNEHLV